MPPSAARPQLTCAAQRSRGAFTLVELLAVLAMIAILSVLSIHAWQSLFGAGTRGSGVAMVMDALEHARSEAIGSGRDVWVVIRQGGSGSRASLRIVAGGRGETLPLGGWIMLPPGARFSGDAREIAEAMPPADIASAAGEGQVTGAVMFRRSGVVGWPKEGDASLVLRLENGSGTSVITVARGTGRASLDSP
jgi:prepilin-type N-terminal cleavage/methylation domain-containing protein